MTGSIGGEADTESRLRIVIADDHALVRGGLALLIDMAVPNAEILQANTLEQVTGMLEQNRSVDLVLLDLMMPGMHGHENIKSMCHSWPEIPIIIVSVKEDTHTIRNALAAGAMGYIPKTSSPDVTVSAIRLVLAGGVYVPPHALQLGLDPSSDNVNGRESNPKTRLTQRQVEVLDLLVSGKSNQSIATELGLTTGTIKMHLSTIFKKLDVSSRTEAAMKYSELRSL